MNQNEQALFIELCRFQDSEKERIASLLKTSASPEVLGELFMNRMQAIAYGTLQKNGLSELVNREFRNSLSGAYEQNCARNHAFFQCTALLSDILRNHMGRYAMLKGALLCGLYPEGYRTSNDVDLLIRPDDVTEIGKALSDAGFQQGNVRNDVFIPASRQEIIASKMMRGETVPYIKEVDLPYLRFFEVDLNFSLDYKNGDSEVLSDMLGRTETHIVNGLELVTLSLADFFIHLCCHLYKEATTLPWVTMRRDMTLYKFSDISLLLHQLNSQEIERIFQRAEQLRLAAICSAAVLWTEALLGTGNNRAVACAKAFLTDENVLHTVISPAEHKKFLYIEKDIRARFFYRDRMALLKEVPSCAV